MLAVLITSLQIQLRFIKKKLGAPPKIELGEFLIEIFKKRVTETEWQGIVYEARQRYEAQEPPAGDGAVLAARPADNEG